MLDDINNDIKNDPFFHPKDMMKREDDLKQRNHVFVNSIEEGLKKIKELYKHKQYDSESEKMFLETFSKLHLDVVYMEKYGLFTLKDEEENFVSHFDIANNSFTISSSDGSIIQFLQQKLKMKHTDVERFMRLMFKKYFKLNDFAFYVISSYSNPKTFE